MENRAHVRVLWYTAATAVTLFAVANIYARVLCCSRYWTRGFKLIVELAKPHRSNKRNIPFPWNCPSWLDFLSENQIRTNKRSKVEVNMQPNEKSTQWMLKPNNKYKSQSAKYLSHKSITNYINYVIRAPDISTTLTHMTWDFYLFQRNFILL